MNITAYFSKIILGCTLLFLWAPHAHGMAFVRRFFKPGAILNGIYNLGTWERPKTDQQGKPVLDENGTQIFERLHTMRDNHNFSDYEAVQIADTIKQMKSNGARKTSLFIENPHGRKHPFTVYSSTCGGYTYGGYNAHSRAMLAKPLPRYCGILYGLHYTALKNKLDVKNIDCREIVQDGVASITPAGRRIIHPEDRNTTPIKIAIDVFKNYAKETKELQQKTAITLTPTDFTVANLKKELRPHAGKTVYELYGGKSFYDIVDASCFSPYKYPAAFLYAVGHQIIEERALLETSRKDTPIADRYLAMGGTHIDSLEGSLQAQGWQKITESGVSTYQMGLEDYLRAPLRSAVDIAAHFRTLPPRGAPMPPAPGFFARLKNLFVEPKPRNTVKIQTIDHRSNKLSTSI